MKRNIISLTKPKNKIGQVRFFKIKMKEGFKSSYADV